MTSLPTRLEGAAASTRFTDDDAVEFLKALSLPHRSTVGRGLARRALNGSIDAAVALAERVLQGWVWEIRFDDIGGTVQGAPTWWLEGLAAPDEGGVSCDAATPALALCAAVVRAHAEQVQG